MKEFNLAFWELQEVWNKRIVIVKTDKNPLELTIDDINHQDFEIEWVDVIATDYGDVVKMEEIQILNDAFNPDVETHGKYLVKMIKEEE